MKKQEDSYNPNDDLSALAGEEKAAIVAFKKLYDQYYPGLFIAAKKFLKSADMAEDVVQEVFLAIWDRRTKLTHVNQFDLYLYRIAKNKVSELVIAQLKSNALRQEYAARMKVADDGEYKEQRLQQIENLVQAMPKKRKEIFILAKLEGLRYDAIARRLNISLGVVQHTVTKALKFINDRKHDVISLIVGAVAWIQRFIDN
jgi:RNA polymerase sigma-70 factor (family 1)